MKIFDECAESDIAMISQLARLKEEAEENSKKQEAAKAVLNAAKAAKREGRAFTEADISSIESPILGRGVQTAEKVELHYIRKSPQ